MTPQNVFDLISSMKVLGASEPERAKAVLNDNPQLSYALFQALLMMNLVEPSSLQVNPRRYLLFLFFFFEAHISKLK